MRRHFSSFGSGQAVKDILIVGDGIAALSAATSLGRHYRVKLIIGSKSKLFSKKPKDLAKTKGRWGGDVGRSGKLFSKPAGQNTFDPYLGIWTGGLQCLSRIHADLLSELEEHGSYMGDAGYMIPSGTWLAKPSKPLLPLSEGGPANILFVQQSKLIEALKAKLSLKNVEVIQEDLEEHTNDLDRVSVTLSTGKVVHGDILVGADGRTSLVRAQMLASTGTGTAEKSGPRYDSSSPVPPPGLSYLGYRIYRGVARAPLTPFSFQTWGGGSKGSRFAAVPLKDGHAWYATIKGPPMSANGEINFLENSEKLELIRTFEGWHDPIGRLIDQTVTIGVEDARGMTSLPEGSLGRVILIGDSAHTLDPVLAMGVSLIFEDVTELSTVLNTLAPHANAEVPGALHYVALRRRLRSVFLTRVSNVSTGLGQATGSFAAVRDGLAKGLPDFAKSFAFDTMLKLVAGRDAHLKAGPR